MIFQARNELGEMMINSYKIKCGLIITYSLFVLLFYGFQIFVFIFPIFIQLDDQTRLRLIFEKWTGCGILILILM